MLVMAAGGCSTPSSRPSVSAPVPAVDIMPKDIVASSAVVQNPPPSPIIYKLDPSKTICLAWDSNYIYDNEFTAVVGYTNIAEPKTNWWVLFSGHATNCTLSNLWSTEFFAAYNNMTN
jgi:hypothetical protein